jgi:hypothetical protein
VIETIETIDLTTPGSPSLIMRDLSEYATLAFLAAFEVQPPPGSKPSQTGHKRVTYIALSKKVMPLLADLFIKFKSSPVIYEDGTIEAILSVSVKHVDETLLTHRLLPWLGLFHSHQIEV